MKNQTYYKETITFTVLHDGTYFLENLSLYRIVDECETGDMVLHSREHKVEEVNAKQAADLLYEAGSQPEFFRLDDEGNESNGMDEGVIEEGEDA